MTQKTDVPIQYIDSLKTKQHLALIYENSEYARLIETRFIKNGLDQGQNCLFATEEDSGQVILSLMKYGIPLEYFKQRKIRVHQISQKTGDREHMLALCRAEIGNMLSNLQEPFRIVSRIVPNIRTTFGIGIQMELEECTHKEFTNFGGCLICPYDISEIEPSRKHEWIERLEDNHDAVIYATKFGQGRVAHR